MVRIRFDFLFSWGWSDFHSHDRNSISFFLGPSKEATQEFLPFPVDAEGFARVAEWRVKTHWFFRRTDRSTNHKVFVPGFMLIISKGK